VIHLTSGRLVKLGFFFVADGVSAEHDLARRVADALKSYVETAK
jgi:hypothetical protein